MKTKLISTTIALGFICFTYQTKAQNKAYKKTVTVLNVDSKGLALDPSQMGNLVRLELEKLDTFEVIDRYDVKYLVEKNNLNINDCYGKLCLVEIGKTVKSDKMFSGSIDAYGDYIIITLRLIDVTTGTIETTQVKEFLNLPQEIQTMVEITVREMFGLSNDQTMMVKLTKPNNYESTINNPDAERLNLSGPRMGGVVFTGETADRLRSSRSNGGYDAIPLMFQFGYQFEKQYLNSGNFQALFEFLPVVTGLDQGLFIPSFTFMNGLRNNKNGWEFAFGPTLNFVKKADGYYDSRDNKWYQKNDWKEKDNNQTAIKNPNEIVSRLDSRGDLAMNTGFVFAFGKTFKSGKLNIPVNLFVIPSNNGWRFGASFGYNAKKNKSN